MTRPNIPALFGFITLFALTSASRVYGDNTPSLVINSPVNETVIQPGQVIQVTVNATNPSLIASEGVVGETPLGFAAFQAGGNQLVFSLQVPNNITPGRYYVTAVGALTSGGDVRSSSVSLVVPMTAIFSSLQVVPQPLVLPYPGAQDLVEVRGLNGTGQSTIDAGYLAFSSANSKIATVSRSGMVTAQASGVTSISVNYGSGNSLVSATLNVQVLGTVKGDLNGDGKVDTDDLNILDSALNTPANGPNDARDLNHDGVINALDARILVTLCAKPGCATH